MTRKEATSTVGLELMGPTANSMPTEKGKGPSTSQCYRPAAGYDDATLAEKREYWRTKKREQRARLSQQRRKPQERDKIQHLSASAPLTFSPSGPLNALSVQHQTLRSGSTVQDSSLEAAESQKEKWLQTMKLNKVLPRIAASAANNAPVVSCLKAKGRVTSSGTQLGTSSSVPPVKVTRFTNGSSVKTTPSPYVSMQGPSVSRRQHKASVALRIQPRLLPTDVTAGRLPVSSPRDPVSVKTEWKTLNTTPQSRTTRALVTARRAEGSAQPSLESEDERAAKRREQWRLKKREQRAKLAACVAKAREKTMCVETNVQRQPAKRTGLVDDTGLQQPSPVTFPRAAGWKQCVKPGFTSAKGENLKSQSQAVSLAAGNLQAQGSRTAQTAIASDVTSGRKTAELQRRFPSYVHLSVPRGFARCKTPRQRFIDSQKNLMNQRSVRCKSLLVSSVLGTRNLPRIDPSDTPEQVLAKRREYWRIKKHEQRAKLSPEVKARLKEKDSLMRRVKRYQNILEDMRKARAPSHSAGSAHAPEAIGGFIKEDGTVTINIPKRLTDGNTAAQKGETHKNTLAAQPCHQPKTEPACSVQATGQSENKPPKLRTPSKSTNVSHPTPVTIQAAAQLTLTHPKARPHVRSEGCATGLSVGGCVMKMAVSSAATPPALDSGLTEEERMAKKREYWRTKKREQRAARAQRLKQGVCQPSRGPAERATPPSKTEPVLPLEHNVKQESESMPAADLNSQPEQAICPDIKPPTFAPAPPPVPPQESDTTLSADSQAATLLAVASMKKLLEESLSTVTDSSGVGTDVEMETTEQDIKPDVPQLFFVKDEVAPLADLTLQIKSEQLDADALEHTGSLSPHLNDLPHLPPPEISSEEVPLSSSEHSSQASSNTSEAAGGPSSQSGAHWLPAKNPSHQTCCSPEPPKLHHLPMDQLQEQCQTRRSPPARGHVAAQSGSTSIQRKREYWRLMKRQQRARLKASQGGTSPRNMQVR